MNTYENKLQELQKNKKRDFWKPAEGKHSVLIEEEVLSLQPQTITFSDGNTQDKISINVTIDGKPLTLSVGYSAKATVNSFYGQLIKVGAVNGTTKGLTVTVVVKGEGKNRSYTILEALDSVTTEQVAGQ